MALIACWPDLYEQPIELGDPEKPQSGYSRSTIT